MMLRERGKEGKMMGGGRGGGGGWGDRGILCNVISD